MIRVWQKVLTVGWVLGVLGMVATTSYARGIDIPSRPTGYVNDYARILDATTKRSIENVAYRLEQETTAQISVVTVDTTGSETIEGYAVQLFEKWGIGQSGKDNGVLLLIAAKDRKVRIEVGYGLEGALTDAMSRSIIERYIVPQFKAGNYSRGVTEGASAIVSVVAKEYGVTITGQEAQVYERVTRKPSAGAKFFNFIFTLLFFIFVFGSRSGLLWMMLLGPGFRRRGGYWHGSGFGGSGGGFGGGFGGFGGGMSGGGGASGGW